MKATEGRARAKLGGAGDVLIGMIAANGGVVRGQAFSHRSDCRARKFDVGRLRGWLTLVSRIPVAV